MYSARKSARLRKKLGNPKWSFEVTNGRISARYIRYDPFDKNGWKPQPNVEYQFHFNRGRAYVNGVRVDCVMKKADRKAMIERNKETLGIFAKRFNAVFD